MLKMHPQRQPAGPPGRSATRLLAAVAPTVVHHHPLAKAPAQLTAGVRQRRVRVTEVFWSGRGGGGGVVERYVTQTHFLRCHGDHHGSIARKSRAAFMMSCQRIETGMSLKREMP